MGETHEFDLKEFVDNLDWESADVQAKIGTRRAGAPAPDDIRWIDRIYNLPDYMRTFYDNHGKRVQEVLNGGSNYLSNPAADQVSRETTSSKWNVSLHTLELRRFRRLKPHNAGFS